MAGEQSIQLINAIAIARGTSEPTNRDVLWIDENITGLVYEKTKYFNTESGAWELYQRNAQQILDDLKTVDGEGSGLDADTLQGRTPAQLMQEAGGVPALSTGQLLVGQGDTIGTAQTVSGIATIDASGVLSYVNNSISHTGLTDVGTNTHAQIDSKLASIDNIEGNLTNIGTLGAGQDGYALTWDNATSRFIMASVGGDSIYTASGTVPSSVVATLTDTLTFNGGTTIVNGNFDVNGSWRSSVGTLNINSSNQGFVGIGLTDTTNGYYGGFYRSTTGDVVISTSSASNGVTVRTDGVDRFNVDNNGNILIGASSKIGAETITLDSPTAIKGSGTLGTALLTLYDNDTTPAKLWEWLDNGNVNINQDTDFELSGNDLAFNGNSLNTKVHIHNTTDAYSRLLVGGEINTFNGIQLRYIGNDVSVTNPNDQNKMGLFGEFNHGPLVISNQATSDNAEIWFNISDGSTDDWGATKRRMLITKNDISIHNAGLIVDPSNTGTPTKIGTENVSLQGSTLVNDKFEIQSTTAGFLMPRMTTAQMNAIATPDTHLLIFNTDLNGIYRYDGSAWVALSTGYGIISVNDSSGQPTFYADLQTAVDATADIDTVYIHSDIELTSVVTLPFRSNLTINMQGHRIWGDTTSGDFNLFDTVNSAGYRELHTTGGGIIETVGTAVSVSAASPMNFNIGNTFSRFQFGTTLIKSENAYCIDISGGAIYGGYLYSENSTFYSPNSLYNSKIRIYQSSPTNLGVVQNCDIYVVYGSWYVGGNKTFIDNVIKGTTTKSANDGLVHGSASSRITNNTIIMEAGGTQPALHVRGSATDSHRIRNNVVTHYGSGDAGKFIYGSSYNNTFYAENGRALDVGGNCKNVVGNTCITNSATSHALVTRADKCVDNYAECIDATHTGFPLKLEIGMLEAFENTAVCNNNATSNIDVSSTGMKLANNTMSETGTGINWNGNTNAMTNTPDTYNNIQIG